MTSVDVFFAYARSNREAADSLDQGLRAAGLTVFRDLDIQIGERWRDAIFGALDAAKLVVVLWSGQSANSEWVRAEAQIAVDRRKYFPILLDGEDVPLGFSHIQYFDLRQWNGSTSDPLFKHLIEAIKKALVDDGEAPPEEESPGERVVVDKGRQYTRLRNAPKQLVFISHASADKPRLGPVLRVLIDQGFSLWVDKPHEIGLSAAYEARISDNRIPYGSDWKESIRKSVKKSDLVLAFWSKDAVEGRREQFHYEVYLGMMQRKLSQCRIDKVERDQIGMPYTFDQIADLSEFDGDKFHPELDYLMQDMADRHQPWWSMARWFS